AAAAGNDSENGDSRGDKHAIHGETPKDRGDVCVSTSWCEGRSCDMRRRTRNRKSPRVSGARPLGPGNRGRPVETRYAVMKEIRIKKREGDHRGCARAFFVLYRCARFDGDVSDERLRELRRSDPVDEEGHGGPPTQSR